MVEQKTINPKEFFFDYTSHFQLFENIFLDQEQLPFISEGYSKDEEFITEKEVLDEISLEISDKEKEKRKIIQCEHCVYSTYNPQNLKLHIRKHTGETIKCEHCDYSTYTTRNLKKHILKHSTEKIKCEHCDYFCYNSRNLKSHMRKHTEEKIKCEHCDYSTHDKRYLKDHDLVHQTEQKDKKYTCEECDISFIIKLNYTNHLRLHPKKELFTVTEFQINSKVNVSYNCTKCKYSTKRLRSMNKHLKEHIKKKVSNIHFQLNLKTEQNNFSHFPVSIFPPLINNPINNFIPFIPTINTSINNFSGISLSSFNIPVPIFTSGQIFYFNSNLEYHCKKCEYSTNTLNNLEIHEKTHKKDKIIYNCDKCSYFTRNFTHIKRHLYVHKDITSFKCEKCDIYYNTKSSLNEHICEDYEYRRTNDKNNFYSCTKCKYSTDRKNDLTRHIEKYHTYKPLSESNPFRCNICEYICQTEVSLHRHSSYQHRENDFFSSN